MTQSAQVDPAAERLTAAQSNMVMILWVSYAAFYLGRLNISPALPEIAESLQIGLGEVGILGNVFFWCYAVGQVISGQLGTIFPPHWVVFAGLVLVALANIGFAFQNTLPLMAVLWGINGFAQSMGWGPILRILSSRTTPAQKRRLALIFSMTFQVGTSLAWGFSAVLIAVGGFELAFLIPGICLLGVAVFWRAQGLDVDAATETAPTGGSRSTLTDIVDDLRHVFPALLIAALIGFIYVGFLLWLPTLIRDWDFLPDFADGILTAIVPLIGIPGMLLSGRLLARQANVFRTMAQLLAAVLMCLVVITQTSGGLQVPALLLTVMFASGLAGLTLSAAPMILVAPNRVSSAGGLLTAVWSISGGLAGSVVGSVVEDSGWQAVYGLWIVICALALLIAVGAWGWNSRHTTSRGGNL